MSKENQVRSKPPVSYSTATSRYPSSSAKSNKSKSTVVNWSSSTEPLRKQMISELVISKSPRVSLHPIRLNSKANGLFGRVILDSVVEPLFATCLACKKILHFQNSRDGSGNLKRHLEICAANKKVASLLQGRKEVSIKSSSLKGR